MGAGYTAGRRSLHLLNGRSVIRAAKPAAYIDFTTTHILTHSPARALSLAKASCVSPWRTAHALSAVTRVPHAAEVARAILIVLSTTALTLAR